MKQIIGLGLVLICLVLIAPVNAESLSGEISGKVSGAKLEEFVNTRADTYEYTLGPGDVLEITTWKDESLSKVVPILPDGKIHFPLIGQVDAAGKTVDTLRQEIEERISVYVPDPYVGVSVQQINSMIIYVIGKVNHPGRFVLNSDVNVLQALAMAGGLNTFAKGDEINIIREDNGDQQIIAFDYDKVAKGKAIAGNIFLKKGDVIVVP